MLGIAPGVLLDKCTTRRRDSVRLSPWATLWITVAFLQMAWRFSSQFSGLVNSVGTSKPWSPLWSPMFQVGRLFRTGPLSLALLESFDSDFQRKNISLLRSTVEVDGVGHRGHSPQRFPDRLCWLRACAVHTPSNKLCRLCAWVHYAYASSLRERQD